MPPRTDAARAAFAEWAGPVEDVHDAAPAPVLIDAVFGTGLSRPLDAKLAAQIDRLARAAQLAIAVDLPSCTGTDDGSDLADPAACFHLTLALGALKPAHVLQPAAARMGQLRVIDLGLAMASGDLHILPKPEFIAPSPDAHKYARGMVVVIEGTMPGAATLAAEAALHAGAGYALLLGEGHAGPHALVRRQWSATALDEAFQGKSRTDVIRGRSMPVVLTPHAGEFADLFGISDGSKIDAARIAAERSGAIVVFKGADTVVAHPDGKAAISLPGNGWLSTAGTGDVLAGTIGAMLAAGRDDAAEAGVWLHGAAAWRLGGPFLADDLARALAGARAAA
jgi:NAD(P)H-hydrate repair Nnr-like enzyme with NAD(P)H-hydrate dehydratase domain